MLTIGHFTPSVDFSIMQILPAGLGGVGDRRRGIAGRKCKKELTYGTGTVPDTESSESRTSTGTSRASVQRKCPYCHLFSFSQQS